MTVIDIRGTNGSGKSYIMNQLLTVGQWESVEGLGQATKNGPTKRRHLGYLSEEYDTVIVGSYDGKSAFSGGCDLLFPEEVVRRSGIFNKLHKYVLLEGILVSHTYKRYNQVALDMDDDYHFYFLNTPLRTCLARIRARRRKAVANAGREFGMESVIKDWHQIWERTRAKLVESGRNVTILDYKDPMTTICNLLGIVRKL